jgi:hypothetical protein
VSVMRVVALADPRLSEPEIAQGDDRRRITRAGIDQRVRGLRLWEAEAHQRG